MQAGKLRHRVTIQSATQVPLPDGDTAEHWAAIPLGTAVPCSITALSGSETRVGAQQQPIATSEIKLRFRADVKEDMRVIHGERTLNIVRAFDPDGRQRELVLWVKEAK